MIEPSANGLRAFRTLRRYLTKKHWAAEEIEGQYSFKARRDAAPCPANCFFQVKADLEQFLFYVVPIITLDKDMLMPVAEYITRANAGMRIGNWELDFRDGQVSFKSSINFAGERLSERLIDNAIEPALKALEEYYPGLALVFSEAATPAAAILRVEYG